MKKVAWWFLGLYAVYILFILWYFFIWVQPGVPAEFKGTAADPNIFMTHHQITLSQDYSRIQDLIYFLTIPLDWGIYLFILIFGFSRWLRHRSEDVSKFSFVHTLIYFLALSLLTWLISLPINYIAHQVSIHFGVSVQPLGSWLRDSLVSFWINWLISFCSVLVMYFFIRRFQKRWWLPVWVIAIPFMLFMTYIQPVWIDPLFNDFHSLKNGPLKTEILDLAHQADIPAHNVYEVNMSEKTNGLNAYVNGIGSHLRIVLWDTTLDRLDDKEVLFVMAHEMGHYVKHHLIWSVIGSIFATLVGLYIASKLFAWSIRKWGRVLGIKGTGDLASVPILLLIISLLSFVATPIENAFSRHAEHSADTYAIKMTQDKEDGISAFQKLSVAGLSDVNPPGLVKFFEYGHPTMLERITFLEEYKVHQKETTTKDPNQ
ncbi:Zn-dependent protease with chaperone function [Pullulanibacillus pueri]|uniref:Metalloprotease n=1 Tax=Pullulanibacillus pueri TaxID=1437324 RepID=A0A8J3EPB8_9BACL|nr:M48 family metallopeptidase [Pullulanibacillus pueri]MBM7680473.1 Zn-dependent protease with chaperone function [Pullulanibacillus pueri]GGH88172.1 metalloprotease [Pullulanibacillus pueri]